MREMGGVLWKVTEVTIKHLTKVRPDNISCRKQGILVSLYDGTTNKRLARNVFS